MNKLIAIFILALTATGCASTKQVESSLQATNYSILKGETYYTATEVRQNQEMLTLKVDAPIPLITQDKHYIVYKNQAPKVIKYVSDYVDGIQGYLGYANGVANLPFYFKSEDDKDGKYYLLISHCGFSGITGAELLCASGTSSVFDRTNAKELLRLLNNFNNQ